MTAAEYADWLRLARRFSRVAHEAEDVLHDALLAAVHAGRADLRAEDDRRWFTGVLRNQAAMWARSEGRRRAREDAAAQPAARPHAPEPTTVLWERLGLERLPRSARSVLVLALHSLRRDEIADALGITPGALRQRLVVLRKHLGALPDALQHEALALAYARRRERAEDHAIGLIRRALLMRLHGTDPESPPPDAERGAVARRIGTHDPDGHLLLLRKKT